MDRPKRRAARVALVLRVDYPDAAELASDYTLDIGAGGLFVHTEVPFEVGQTIDLRLSFPGLLAPLEVTGTVRWRRAPGGAGPCGVGVEFTDQGAGERDLEQLLTSRDRAAGRPIRILLVEDSSMAHDAFRHATEQLAGAGFPTRLDLRSAFDADGGYTELMAGDIDLTIVNLDLPGLSGLELISQIRAMPGLAAMPIVAIASPATGRAEAIAAGADLCVDRHLLMVHLLGTLATLASAATPAVRPPTVAIIDDSPLVLGVARAALAARGYDVQAFESAMDFDPRSFDQLDLLLIDVVLTEFFGDDILAFLREELGLEARVLLYSQLDDAELARRAATCGAAGYVSKRAGPLGLVAAVEGLLGPASAPAKRP